VRLTPEQRALVLQEKPMVEALVNKLKGMFGRAALEDLTQMVWTGLSEAVVHYDPAKGPFGRFGWKRAFGKGVEDLMRDARQAPLYLARRAFGDPADGLKLASTDDPWVDDRELLEPIKAACHEGAFRMFFGATFETWRMQGDQGLVDHVTRQRVFRALQAAFTTLAPDEWRLLELYYIECLTWADVGVAFDISERQAKRRDADVRKSLKRELLARGVKAAPPEAA
jgi:RNA polymerase sigma factor (sigma-70 family)